MSLFRTSVQHPLGLNPGAAEQVRVIVRGGTDLKIGTVVQFTVDDADDGAVAAGLTYGGTDDPMSNVIPTIVAEAVATQALWTLYAILKEDINDDAEGWAYIRGDIPLAWDAASDAIASGGGPVDAVGLMSLVSANADRVIAIARETTVLYVSGDGTTLTQCYFDGINGFGQFNA